jgi:hypothetical protein
MNDFFKKIFLFLSSTFIIYNVIIFAFLQMYPECFITNTRDFHIINEQYNRIQKGTSSKNLIVGDSRANTGILVSEMGSNYVNFSLPGSTFIEGFYTVKNLTNKSKIDTLILGYSLDYLISGNHWFDERTIQISNPIISLSDVLAVNTLEFNKAQSISGNKLNKLDQIKRILKFVHAPFMYGANFWDNLENLILKRLSKPIVLKSVSFNNGNFFFPQQSKINREVVYITGDPNRVIDSYADSIIELSKAKNFKVFLCIPPSFDKFPQQILDAFEHKGYKIIQPLILDENCFSDESHLNRKGAFKYSKYLRIQISNAL